MTTALHWLVLRGGRWALRGPAAELTVGAVLDVRHPTRRVAVWRVSRLLWCSVNGGDAAWAIALVEPVYEREFADA